MPPIGFCDTCLYLPFKIDLGIGIVRSEPIRKTSRCAPPFPFHRFKLRQIVSKIKAAWIEMENLAVEHSPVVFDIAIGVPDPLFDPVLDPLGELIEQPVNARNPLFPKSGV